MRYFFLLSKLNYFIQNLYYHIKKNLAYLNGSQLQRLAWLKTDISYLNYVKKIFFKFINYGNKIPDIKEYLTWLKEKYITNKYKEKEKNTNEEPIEILNENQMKELINLILKWPLKK